MKSKRVVSNQMLILFLIMVAVVASGCATKGYVDQRAGELATLHGEQIDQVRKLALQNQSDIRTVTARMNTIEQVQQNLSRQVAEVQGTVLDLEAKVNNAGLQVAMNDDIFFEFGRYRLTTEARAKLDNLVSRLRGTSFEAIHLSGHTDSVGGEAFNFDLGRRRAETVAAYLAQQGIAQHKLHIISLGEQVPEDSNNLSAGRAQNRRVDVRVLESSMKRSVM